MNAAHRLNNEIAGLEKALEAVTLYLWRPAIERRGRALEACLGFAPSFRPEALRAPESLGRVQGGKFQRAIEGISIALSEMMRDLLRFDLPPSPDLKSAAKALLESMRGLSEAWQSLEKDPPGVIERVRASQGLARTADSICRRARRQAASLDSVPLKLKTGAVFKSLSKIADHISCAADILETVLLKRA